MAKEYGAVGILAIFLIVYNCYLCAANENPEIDAYDIYSDAPYLGSYVSVVKLREKRQTPTDQKNQYESISPAHPLDTKLSINATAAGNNATTERTAMTSVVVPISERPLLGVNGTGQRKDYSEVTKLQTPINTQTTASTAAAATPAAAAVPDPSKKPNQFPKKVFTSNTPTLIAADGGSANNNDGILVNNEQEQVIDKIDVPEDDEDLVKNTNYTINRSTENHSYYNSTMYVNKSEADQLWDEMRNHTHHSMLSNSHRRAMTVELSFDFPFYGHGVRNITVATGGFLYTGEYVHSWLAATQYIAPLMANFDTSLSNDSFVRVNDNGTAFTVVWENVALQDKKDIGKFTFSVTLHKNGDILFGYYNIPVLVHTIQDDQHPVKVGLSDAYIIDKMVYFTRRKTIFEYHRINFANQPITNATIIHLTALPTCLDYTDCQSCIAHETTFDCTWCPNFNRCSTGTDRKKQDWLQRGCDRTQIKDMAACPAIGQKGNNAADAKANADATKTSNNTASATNNNSNNNSNGSQETHHSSDAAAPSTQQTPTVNVQPVSTETKAALAEHVEPKNMNLALGFVLPICFVMIVLLWVVYAYRNPHTKSGQLLIQYRPSQWSWRRGEARYTAATIHM